MKMESGFMNRIECNDLIEKVKIYRPFYPGALGNSTLLKLQAEWYEQLKDYDYKDVEQKLIEFLIDNNNSNKIPNPYQLKVNLITTSIKSERSKYTTSCKFCGRFFNYHDLSKHENRCRSVKYIEKMCKKYYEKDLSDKKMMYEISDEEFDKKYIESLEKFLPRVDDKQKELISKVLETYKEEKLC